MSLRSELVALEEGLAITAPVPITAPSQVFDSLPDTRVALGRRQVVFENHPFSIREVGQMGSFEEYVETIKVRCSVYDADLGQAIEIADAYKAVFMNAIAYQRNAGRRLNSTFDYVEMRDSNEPFASFDGRAGWEVMLDFSVFRTVVAP